MGPGCWDGAKKALEDVPKNIVFPTRTRVVKRENDGRNMYFYTILVIAIAVLLVSLCFHGILQRYF